MHSPAGGASPCIKKGPGVAPGAEGHRPCAWPAAELEANAERELERARRLVRETAGGLAECRRLAPVQALGRLGRERVEGRNRVDVGIRLDGGADAAARAAADVQVA